MWMRLKKAFPDMGITGISSSDRNHYAKISEVAGSRTDSNCLR